MWKAHRIPTAWRVVARLKRRARASVTEERICGFVDLMTNPLTLLVALAVMVVLAFISAPLYWR